MYHNFNPRSREGSDRFFWEDSAVSLISIHAPAKGATSRNWSIFRPHTNFNPRSHEGSDHFRNCSFTRVLISIHTPTKGATISGKIRCVPNCIFQSTLPRRERLYSSLSLAAFRWFQSTLPRRERRTYQTVFLGS